MILSPDGIKSLPENVLSINLSSLKKNMLSTGDMEKNIAEYSTYEDYFKQEKGKSSKKNVIIIFSESLSAIDSLRVG
jgi:hypothetical protein